jgi:DNA-damage-inducible protein J
MGAINVTVRVDEDVKREFDLFCENVGISFTAALNMYIKTVLRTRQLPFIVTDIPTKQTQARQSLKQVLRLMQEDSVRNGTDKMTMEEIDAEIAAYRQEKRAQSCQKS